MKRKRKKTWNNCTSMKLKIFCMFHFAFSFFFLFLRKNEATYFAVVLLFLLFFFRIYYCYYYYYCFFSICFVLCCYLHLYNICQYPVMWAMCECVCLCVLFFRWCLVQFFLLLFYFAQTFSYVHRIRVFHIHIRPAVVVDPTIHSLHFAC